MQKQTKFRSWTVILNYPDYAQTGTGNWPETYIDYARARTKEEAAAKVQKKAAATVDIGCDDPTDFKVIGVILGSHKVFAI